MYYIAIHVRMCVHIHIMHIPGSRHAHPTPTTQPPHRNRANGKQADRLRLASQASR